MLPTIDADLIGGVGIAFQAWRALAQQRAGERRTRAIQPCSSTQIDAPQRLRPSIAGLVDQHAATLHQHPYLHQEVRRHGAAAQHKAQQGGQVALLHLIILVDICCLERSSEVASRCWHRAIFLY
jgi:hypothetical protein